MALFGRKTEPPVNPEQQADSNTQLATTIATAVATALQPMFQRQQFAPANPEPPQRDEPPPQDDIDPDEAARIARVAGRVFQQGVGSYQQAFNNAMPEIVRDTVVNKLTEGQRIIYERHKGEVDHSLDVAAKSDPSVRANPEFHRKAIALVLGEHTDEIEQVIRERMQAEDLPVHLQPPNTSQAGQQHAEPLTELERNQVDYFNSSSSAGRRSSWDADNLRYYKTIKPGYLSDMIAEHKARQAAVQQGNQPT
jgi:hypothetical protein